MSGDDRGDDVKDLRITSHRMEDRVVTVQEKGSISLLNLAALRGLVAECAGMSGDANVYVSRLSDSNDYVGLKWVGRIEVRGSSPIANSAPEVSS